MSTAIPTSTGEMFRQGMETFEAAMKAAARIQEESARRFADMLQEMGSPMQWQKRFQTVMTESVSMTQKNLDEAVKVMNQNAKATMELFQKALRATAPQQGDERFEPFSR